MIFCFRDEFVIAVGDIAFLFSVTYVQVWTSVEYTKKGYLKKIRPFKSRLGGTAAYGSESL